MRFGVRYGAPFLKTEDGMEKDTESLECVKAMRDYLEKNKNKEFKFTSTFGKKVKFKCDPEIIEKTVSYLDRIECFQSRHDEFEDDLEKRRGADFEKVIFLDIDGVLNDDHSSTLENCLFDELLERFKRIVDATGAVVVLISSWRLKFDRYFNYIDGKDPTDEEVIAGARQYVSEDDYKYSYKEYVLKLLDYFTENGIRIVGRTESIDDAGRPYLRPAEVRHWLRNKPFVKSFVIIDDEYLWPWGWMQHHVVYSFKKVVKLYGPQKLPHTEIFRGLTDEDADRAISILNDYEAVRDLDVESVMEAAKGMDADTAAEVLCERFCVDLNSLKDKTEGKIALGERRSTLPRSEFTDSDYFESALEVMHEADRKYGDVYHYLYKQLDDLKSNVKLRCSDIYREKGYGDRFYEWKGTTVAIVCADVLTDEEVLTSSNIDPEKLALIEKLVEKTGCRLALYGKGLNELHRFFFYVMHGKNPQVRHPFIVGGDGFRENPRYDREKDIKCRNLSDGARQSLSEESANLLEFFMSRGIDVIGVPRYFSDGPYDLPYSVREWTFEYPFMAGFVIFTGQDKAWGWMKENAVVGELTQESVDIAASKLNSYSLNIEKDRGRDDEYDRRGWIFAP